MKFPHFFIDRPIFAAVLSILIIVFGVVAYPGLPVAQYPEIAPPTVVVNATFPGANAETLAATVAAPLEESINGVENMIYMSSSATGDGALAITVTFKQGTNVDQAQVLVQNRVSTAEPRLPEEVRQIGVTVRKNSPDILMVVALTSPDGSLSSSYVSNYATTQLIDRLSRIPGVGGVRVFGGRDYNMRVWVDPDRAASRNLTVDEITAAVRAQNAQVAAGSVGQPPFNEGGTAFQLGIQATGRLTKPEEFGAIIVKRDDQGRLTRLRDVARIELGAQDYTINAMLNNKSMTAIGITQLPGSNALSTADAVKAEVANVAKTFPPGLTYSIPYNPTEYIQASIEAVEHTLVEALVLVALVVLLFLQSWRAALVPIIAIPVSLLGSLAVLAGFRLLAQQPVAVRHGARDRDRGRRRDRRGREYRTPDGRGGPLPVRCRAQDDGRSVGRADRDCTGAVRGVHPDELHPGHLGAILSAVRADDRLGDRHLGVRLADAVARARCADPQAQA